MSLIRAREAVMAPIRTMLLNVGITEQQWRVLRVLKEFGPQDAGHLARRAGLMAPSLSRIIQSMKAGGLVQLETDEKDRRRQRIAISDKGLEIIETHFDEAAEIAAHFRDVLGDEDHDKLLTLLQKLAKSMENTTKP